MARPLRIEFPGAVYHLTSRGNARLPIFEDDNDRRRFLDILGEVVDRYNWLCYAWCLMDNHYHLLIETLDGNLSLGMRHLNGVYTQSFNRRHGRPGHLFQGRYKSIIVDKEGYLLELCRYVVLNPVRADMVRRPGDYTWSSFRMTAGQIQSKPLLETESLLAQFGNTLSEARAEYVRFVYAGTDDLSPWESLKGQCILGDESYVQKIEPALKDKSMIMEIPRRERLVYRPSLEELLKVKNIADRRKRDRFVTRSHMEFGYTLTEIGKHLGLHYSTISKIVNKGR
jgi:REP element-mobilizing transposase RayT